MTIITELREYVSHRHAYAQKREEAERENGDPYLEEYWKGESNAFGFILERLRRLH